MAPTHTATTAIDDAQNKVRTLESRLDARTVQSRQPDRQLKVTRRADRKG